MGSRMSIDEKMKLVQKLRERQRQAQGETVQETGPGEQYSTLGIRIALAAALFIGFACFYQREEPIYGITAAQVYSAIEENSYANVFDFVDEIPYTLK